MSGGDHKRKPNGILGLLCKEHFPGLVQQAGMLEPAYTWDHYMAVPDTEDREGRNFGTKARRVVGELWVSYPRTAWVNTSHSFEIPGIMTASIGSISRISTGARQDMRTELIKWLIEPVTNW